MSDDKKALLPTPAEPPPSYESSAVALPQRLPPPRSSSSSSSGRGQPPSLAPPPLPPLNLPFLSLLRNRRVVLASASPRRAQLLAHLGLGHAQIIPSREPENLSKTMLSPFEYVLQTATKKALAVYRQEVNNDVHGEPALLLAADTVVVSHVGEILEKPRGEKEHLAMLRTLREGSHHVYTAVAVMMPLANAMSPGYALESSVEATMVQFDQSVSDDMLLAYVRTREGADKAGGYGIQGTGSILIERIEGTYDNVVGLPLRTTLKLIQKIMTRGEESSDDDADDSPTSNEE